MAINQVLPARLVILLTTWIAAAESNRRITGKKDNIALPKPSL
jgi:hypothetical protein